MELDEILGLTKQDAITLKEKLTQADKEKLDYSNLNPFDPRRCLFGQLTGRYDSDLAKELLPKSIFITLTGGFLENSQLTMIKNSRVDYSKINYTPSRYASLENLKTSTPIEVYLMLKTNSEDLYKFIKDEIDEFEPRMLTPDEWTSFVEKSKQDHEEKPVRRYFNPSSNLNHNNNL